MNTQGMICVCFGLVIFYCIAHEAMEKYPYVKVESKCDVGETHFQGGFECKTAVE